MQVSLEDLSGTYCVVCVSSHPTYMYMLSVDITCQEMERMCVCVCLFYVHVFFDNIVLIDTLMHMIQVQVHLYNYICNFVFSILHVV